MFSRDETRKMKMVIMNCKAANGRSNTPSSMNPIMTTPPRPSCCCCLLAILCAILCTTTAMGFATETTNINKRRLLLAVGSSSSSLSWRNKQGKKKPPLHLSSAAHLHHAGALFVDHGQLSSALPMIRGGGCGGIRAIFPSMMDAPLAVQTTVTYASVLFLTVSNLALLVAPNFMLETLYNIKKPSSSSSEDAAVASEDNDDNNDDNVASTTFLRLIAMAGLGVALSLYLAIIQKETSSSSSPPLTAMGWGLVPRTSFFWYLLLFENRRTRTRTNNSTNNNKHLKSSFGSLQENKRFFIINTILTTWVTASLLLRLGNPAMTSKIFSSMSIIKSSLLILCPLSVGTKFVGFDVSRKGMSKTRVLLRAMGNEFLVAAVLMASLAFGINAVKAAGLVFTVWTLLLLDMAFVSKPWTTTLSSTLNDDDDKTTTTTTTTVGPPRPRMAQMVNIVMTLIFAVGFLVVPFK